MNIYINDGGRHRQPTGYGHISRNIILCLSSLGHNVFLQPNSHNWAGIPSYQKEKLLDFPFVGNLNDIDFCIQICSPALCRKMPIPCVAYTMPDFGAIAPAWVEAICKPDAIVCPTKYAYSVFSKYRSFIYVSPPGVSDFMEHENDIKSHSPSSSSEFIFLFIGSFHYRKGIDLIIRSFLESIKTIGENSRLILHCTDLNDSTKYKNVQNILMEWGDKDNRIKIVPDVLPHEEIVDLYNDSHCLICASRGEGWCFPVSDAISRGIPVIAPLGSGLREYLSYDNANIVTTENILISSISDDFGGKDFKKIYGFDGNTFDQPIYEELVRAINNVRLDYSTALTKAKKSQKDFKDKYTWDECVNGILISAKNMLCNFCNK